LSRPTYSEVLYYGAVLSMQESASDMLINPETHLNTYSTWQRFSSTTCSSYQALLAWGSKKLTIPQSSTYY